MPATDLEILLAERIRAGLAIALAAILLFACTDPFLQPTHLGPLALVKLVELGVLGAVHRFVRRPRPRRHLVRVAVAGVASLAATTAVSGVITHESAGTSVLLVVLSMGTALLLPWGVRGQLAGQTAITAAAVGNTQLVANRVLATYVPIAMLVASLAAVYAAYFGERQRRAERRRADEAARARIREHLNEFAHAARLSQLGGMAAGIAHELNQPLAAIVSWARGCVRRIEAGETDVATLRPAIDEIATQALRAAEVLRRVRDFLQAGEPQRVPMDVNAVVREVVHLAEYELHARRVAIRLDLAAAPLPARIDAIQIEQVLLNLVLNACDALGDAPEGARTVVITTARVPPNRVEVRVTDHGRGIAAADAVRIFEPFFSTKPDGLGLGLSISRSIVEAHGGRLEVDVEGPAGTTTFRFVLPTTTPETRHAA